MNYEKEVLAFNRHALQFLHHASGFDFCKPYTIHRIDGRFTFNQVKKLVPENHTAALLIRWHNEGLRWVSTNKFIYATMSGRGFDAERHDMVDYWAYNDKHDDGYHYIDYVTGKGDFEELRKKAALHTYVFIQNRDYMEIPGRATPVLDNVRYSYRFDCGYVYIRRKGYNEKERNYNYVDTMYRRQREKAENCIDKSGYLINRRRADLIRRAAALKAERAKVAADAADYTAELGEIVREFEAARKDLAEAIKRATCFEDFSGYAHRCYDLGHAGSDIHRTRELLENKSFRSIAAIERALQGIRDRINKEV